MNLWSHRFSKLATQKFALKVYLKLNQKLLLITLSIHGKPSLNMQKKSGQIVLYLEIFNFKTFRAEILQIFELLIWKINDLIHSFWHNLTFRKTLRFFFTAFSSTENENQIEKKSVFSFPPPFLSMTYWALHSTVRLSNSNFDLKFL